MPPDAPGELAALRQLLARLLPTAEQLGAFCARHFPTLVAGDTGVLPSQPLVDRLLARATVAEVRYRLALEQPAAVTHLTDYPLQVAAPTRDPRPLRHLPRPRDPAFAGRAEQLGMLRGLLGRHRAAVVTGPSGVGKTALASEFLYRTAGEYAVVYMLDAATPESLSLGIGTFARQLQEHGFLAPTAREPGVAEVRDFLTRRADWLLLLDDVPSVQAVEALLGTGPPAGHVLYTASGEVFPGLAGLALGALTAAESMQLLAQRSDRHKLLPGERLAVQRLAAVLGYWPAALGGVADAVRLSGATSIEALSELLATTAGNRAGSVDGR